MRLHTIKECRKAMANGKKIRMMRWPVDQYFHMDDTNIMNQDLENISSIACLRWFDDVLNDDWEIYEEKKLPLAWKTSCLDGKIFTTRNVSGHSFAVRIMSDKFIAINQTNNYATDIFLGAFNTRGEAAEACQKHADGAK